MDAEDLAQVEIRLKDTDVQAGGSYRPAGCQPEHKLAVIVAYRNRSAQLANFLNHMHLFLQRQQLDYTIYVVEQSSIMLIGFQLFLEFI